MSTNGQIQDVGKYGRSSKGMLLVVAILSLFALFVFVSSVSAQGAQRIAGIGYFEGEEACDEPITNSAGVSPDASLDMTGDLQGCLYIFIETYECMPGGVYIEDGHEIYVGSGAEGDDGTFQTEYRFVAHFPSEADCHAFTNMIRGRCQHPIVAGSGTGDYRGVTGKFQMVDNVEEGYADYLGLLHFR